MNISSYGSLLHLLVSGADAAIPNVLLDGVVEKHSILGNHADVSSQRFLLHLRRDNHDMVITSLQFACKHMQLYYRGCDS